MVIGITGGVGCGKSTVLKLLEERFSCQVIQADLVGHQVMEPKNQAYEEIVSEFGTSILKEDKTIDRKVLGQIVFENKEKLNRLNAIVHPAVKQSIRAFIQECQEKDAKRDVVVEAALLIEDNYRQLCDELWYIYADEEMRKKRLSESRGYTEEKTEQIMQNQLSEEVFRAECDRVIDNRFSMENTYQQIKKILEERGIDYE